MSFDFDTVPVVIAVLCAVLLVVPIGLYVMLRRLTR